MMMMIFTWKREVEVEVVEEEEEVGGKPQVKRRKIILSSSDSLVDFTFELLSIEKRS